MTCICNNFIDAPKTGVTPYTQCPKCAKKHIVAVWTAWQELGHERDNRDYCSGNLRLAAEHLATMEPSLATACRDCAIRIEDFDDFDGDRPIKDDINALRTRIWDLAGTGKMTVVDDPGPDIDLIIPLKPDESWRGQCDELRILLRSIEENARGLNRVCLVTDTIPEWLDPQAQGLVWLPVGNPHRHNKDANLFLKVDKALQFLSPVERWAFSADDCAFLKPCDLRTIPTVFNGHAREHFADPKAGKWHRRMIRTFDFLESRGVEMKYSYDCHLPQAFRSSTVLEKLKNVPYAEGDGFCIYTLWRGLEGKTEGDTPQHSMTTTFCSEKDAQDLPLDKTFCNYSDTPFGAGLRDRLYKLFPHKSHFEK